MLENTTTFADGNDDVRSFLVETPFTHIALVAEDDPWLRTALMTVLDHLGLVAVGVEEGCDLLTWVEPLLRRDDDGGAPDLILSDLMMPGIEALKILKRLANGRPDVPVIVVSGVQDLAVRRLVAELGYVWIDKPIVPARLESAILGAVSELQTYRSMYEPRFTRD